MKIPIKTAVLMLTITQFSLAASTAEAGLLSFFTKKRTPSSVTNPRINYGSTNKSTNSQARLFPRNPLFGKRIQTQPRTLPQTRPQALPTQAPVAPQPRQMTQQEKNAELFLAALNGNLERVTQLHRIGANVYSGTRFGETALHAAASRGHIRVVAYFATHGVDINARTSNGWTALHHAARFKQTNVVKYLLQAGANRYYRTRDRGEKTPLQMAIDNKDQLTVLALRQR